MTLRRKNCPIPLLFITLDPGQLVALVRTDEQGRDLIVSSYPDYRDYRDRNTVFSGLLAHGWVPLSLSNGGVSERLSGAVVSGNYFSVLGRYQ